MCPVDNYNDDNATLLNSKFIRSTRYITYQVKKKKEICSACIFFHCTSRSVNVRWKKACARFDEISPILISVARGITIATNLGE